MRRKAIVAVAAVLAIAVAYLAGYLPERSQRVTAGAHVESLQEKLAGAEARIRVGELLGRALTIKEMAMRQNYGEALERSSVFFDAVRREAATTPHEGLREGLNGILAQRDLVTAALAKGELRAIELLHNLELQLRRALSYEVPLDSSAPTP